MSRRAVLGVIAGLFLFLGLVLGFWPRGGDCGSVFKPDTASAEIYDTLSGSFGGAADACDQALSDGKPLTYGALGIGVIAALLSVAVGRDERPAD